MSCHVKHFILSVFITFVAAQKLEVPVYRLCVDNSVSVKPNSSGIIEYRQGDGQGVGSCSLMISGFRQRSYIGLPGGGAACGNATKVNINNQSYCVNRHFITNTVIISTNGTLMIAFNTSGTKDFTFLFYSSVVECGGESFISDVSQVSQLSGVLVNRYDQFLSTGDCQIKMSVMGRQPFTAHFEILHITGAMVKLGNQTLGSNSRDTSTVSSYNGQIVLNGIATAQQFRFLVKYSVLYCGPPPQINNTIPPPDRLWLVRSDFTYNCVQGYMLNNTKHSTITCDREDASMSGRWSSVDDMLCVPVVCELDLNFLTIDNGNASDVKEKYGYNDKFEYSCDDGYSKARDVKCVDEGIWSGVPECTAVTTDKPEENITSSPSPSGNPPPSSLTTIIGASVGGLVGLAVIVGVVVYFCVRKQRNTETKPKRSENGTNNSIGAYATTDLQLTGTNANSAVRKPKVKDKPQTTGPINPQDVYGQIEKKSRAKQPNRAVNVPAGTVYEESPALPPKQDCVVFEENDLYEGQGNLGAPLNHQHQVEMFDNDLYDRC